MYYKILHKGFVRYNKSWRVIKGLRVWSSARTLSQFLTVMEDLYQLRIEDGCTEVTLSFKDETATLIYTDNTIRYKDFYMFVEK